jgi:hypothetical protein
LILDLLELGSEERARDSKIQSLLGRLLVRASTAATHNG